MDERRNAISRYNSCRCLVIFAAIAAACCGVAVIVCGAVIVRPIVETNSLAFQETNCTTTKGYLTGKSIGCGCGKNCNSEYPCLRILVTHVHGGTTVNAVLFDTEERLVNNRGKSEDSQCVMQTCDRDRNKNHRDVVNFNTTHAAGKTYDCLYNPDNPEEVILKRLFTWDAMVHSMLWTSIAFAFFLGLTVYACYQCKKAGKEVSTMPITIPGAQPGHFLPPGGQPAQPGHFLPTGGQPAQPMQMQPQDPYKTNYGSDKTGYTYT